MTVFFLLSMVLQIDEAEISEEKASGCQGRKEIENRLGRNEPAGRSVGKITEAVQNSVVLVLDLHGDIFKLAVFFIILRGIEQKIISF